MRRKEKPVSDTTSYELRTGLFKNFAEITKMRLSISVVFSSLAGYLLAAVLGIRIVWGFAGPAHARFRNFVRGPATTLSYLGDVAAHRDRRYLGHNPAGAAMIMALLICLAAVTGSGSGPSRSHCSSSRAATALSSCPLRSP